MLAKIISVFGESLAEADSQFSRSSHDRRMDQDTSALDPGLLQAVLADPILLQAVDPRVLQAVLVSAAQATKVVSTLPPPVPAVPEEQFPSVPEESDAEEIDESPDKPQEPLEFSSSAENIRGSLNLNSFGFQDQQRPDFNFPQSPRALNPNQFGGLGGANNFLLNRGRSPQNGNSGFNLPQGGRNFNSFNQPQNPGFGGGLAGFGGQGQGGRGQELVASFQGQGQGGGFQQPQNTGFGRGLAGQSQGGSFRQPQNTGFGGGLAGQGQGGRGKELVASFQGQGGGFRQQQSQGFPRKQQSFNNPQTNQGFNSFNQPGFRGSFNPTQSNFGNSGFGRSFGSLPQAQTPGRFGSEVGGRVKGNPNLEVETFQPGNVSGFSSHLAIFFITGTFIFTEA